MPKAAKNPKGNARAWSLRLGVLLVAEAVAVVVAGGTKTVELTMQYLATDTLASDLAGKGTEVLATATRHLVDVRVSWLVAAFLLVLGATYILAATVWRKKYDQWLDEGVNKLRWAGLGLAGGLTMATVAMLSGVSDVSTLTLILGSILLAGVLATSVELIGDGRKPLRRLLALGAVLAVFLPWLTFVRTLGAVPMYDGALPTFMYFVYSSVTLLVIAVVLAGYLRTKRRGKWADAFYAENMFVALGFVGANIVALQIFAGALQS